MKFKIKFNDNGNFDVEINGSLCKKEYDPTEKKYTVFYPEDKAELNK